jgi:phosphate transport system substrate-binding protein
MTAGTRSRNPINISNFHDSNVTPLQSKALQQQSALATQYKSFKAQFIPKIVANTGQNPYRASAGSYIFDSKLNPNSVTFKQFLTNLSWVTQSFLPTLSHIKLKFVTCRATQRPVSQHILLLSPKYPMTPLKKLAMAATAFHLIACAAAADRQQFSGAGSSAAAPIYQTWAAEYQKKTGISLTYESIGSSAGLKKIREGKTGFGASDVAPGEIDLKKDGLVLFPVAITGIAPVVNLPKLDDGKLRLTGPVLAQIYLGEITQWNAPAISQLNTDMVLPDLPINVVVRSDGSGTTYNFADYLAKVSPGWKQKNGVKSSYTWPANFLSVKGSDGVVSAVKTTPGAIGYVDFGYVAAHRLNPVQMKNADGEFLLPTIAAFKEALFNSEWGSKGRFTQPLTNNPGKGSWPITMGTYVLLPQLADKPQETQLALQFFLWAFINGDSLVSKSQFVRLPDRVQSLAFKAISSVTDRSGKPIRLDILQPEH